MKVTQNKKNGDIVITLKPENEANLIAALLASCHVIEDMPMSDINFFHDLSLEIYEYLFDERLTMKEIMIETIMQHSEQGNSLLN